MNIRSLLEFLFEIPVLKTSIRMSISISKKNLKKRQRKIQRENFGSMIYGTKFDIKKNALVYNPLNVQTKNPEKHLSKTKQIFDTLQILKYLSFEDHILKG